MGEDSVTNLFALFSYRVKSNKPPTDPKLLQLFAERRFSVLQAKAPHLWSRLSCHEAHSSQEQTLLRCGRRWAHPSLLRAAAPQSFQNIRAGSGPVTPSAQPYTLPSLLCERGGDPSASSRRGGN